MDQDYKVVEQKHLDMILSGKYSDLFEDEDVEHVWICYCHLKNIKPANASRAFFVTVAGASAVIATALLLSPLIGKKMIVNICP